MKEKKLLTVVLTGGMSRRMGRDKALLPLDGGTMAQFIAERYRPLGPVAFSVDRAGRFPAGAFLELADLYPGKGPLNGVVSAFSATEADVILLTATDMPCAEPALAERLLEALPGHDACLYRGQPLFGVYARSCLEPARRCLEEGRLSFRDLFARIDALRLAPDGEAAFLNLNTREEYRAFLAERGGKA